MDDSVEAHTRMWAPAERRILVCCEELVRSLFVYRSRIEMRKNQRETTRHIREKPHAAECIFLKAPLAIYTSVTCHIFGMTWINCAGDTGKFCPDQSWTFKQVNSTAAVRGVGRIFFWCSIFSKRAGSGYSQAFKPARRLAPIPEEVTA